MRESKPSCSAVVSAAVLDRVRSCAAHAFIRSHTLLMVSSMLAANRLLGRSCDFTLRCALTTNEVPQPRPVTSTPCTALKLMVEHGLVSCALRTDLISACSDRVLRASACDRRVWSCTNQERPLLKTAAIPHVLTKYMQKERHQSLKVRSRTAIKRAPSLHTTACIACTMAHDLTVQWRS